MDTAVLPTVVAVPRFFVPTSCLSVASLVVGVAGLPPVNSVVGFFLDLIAPPVLCMQHLMPKEINGRPQKAAMALLKLVGPHRPVKMLVPPMKQRQHQRVTATENANVL